MAMKMDGDLQQTERRRWGHLQDETESWDNEGTKEGVRVTIAVIHQIGDMEFEEATSCSQAGIPVEQ